jgi:hypothetical protein
MSSKKGKGVAAGSSKYRPRVRTGPLPYTQPPHPPMSSVYRPHPPSPQAPPPPMYGYSQPHPFQPMPNYYGPPPPMYDYPTAPENDDFDTFANYRDVASEDEEEVVPETQEPPEGIKLTFHFN